MKTTLTLILATAAVAGAVVPLQAQTPAAQAVKTRQHNFKQLGGAFKAINDELKKDQPSTVVLQANAAKLNSLAPQIPHWFPPGSGPQAGVKTGAKSAIWSDPRGFAEASRALQAQAGALQRIAGSGDLNAVRAQARATGGSCKGCHDKFRLEDKT